MPDTLYIYNPDTGEERQIPLNSTRVIIGKDPACNVVLPVSGVSREHCILEFTVGDGWGVIDRGSTNGTILNGIRLHPHRRMPLFDDSVIQILNIQLKVVSSQGQRNEPNPIEQSKANATVKVSASKISALTNSEHSATRLNSEKNELTAPDNQHEASLMTEIGRDNATKSEVQLSPGSGKTSGEVQSEHKFQEIPPVVKPGLYTGIGVGQNTPVQLKRELHQKLLERMDLKHTDITDRSHEELREHTSKVCEALIREYSQQISTSLNKDKLVKEIVDEAIGLGMIEDLLSDPEVDEVMVCNWNKVYVECHGKLQRVERNFTDNAQVVAIMRRILAPLGRRIDETSPMADGRLADGSRVNAVIAPLAISGPTLTIRKFAKTPFQIQDLERFGSITTQMAAFLQLAVRERANIVISGGTGSGKTTLLNVVSNFIPGNERIVTVEDAAELQLRQEHVVRLESRPANLEGKNAILIRDLVRNALRMRPDRIVVGECRGGEALDMLQAMNTGHDGSLTTLHANSPRDALSRLETLVLMSGMELPTRAIRDQIVSAIDFVVQVSRMPDGTRKVTAISEIIALDNDGHFTLADIYQFVQKGYDADGKVLGIFRATGHIPAFAQGLQERGMAVDASLFVNA